MFEESTIDTQKPAATAATTAHTHTTLTMSNKTTKVATTTKTEDTHTRCVSVQVRWPQWRDFTRAGERALTHSLTLALLNNIILFFFICCFFVCTVAVHFALSFDINYIFLFSAGLHFFLTKVVREIESLDLLLLVQCVWVFALHNYLYAVRSIFDSERRVMIVVVVVTVIVVLFCSFLRFISFFVCFAFTDFLVLNRLLFWESLGKSLYFIFLGEDNERILSLKYHTCPGIHHSHCTHTHIHERTSSRWWNENNKKRLQNDIQQKGSQSKYKKMQLLTLYCTRSWYDSVACEKLLHGGGDNNGFRRRRRRFLFISLLSSIVIVVCPFARISLAWHFSVFRLLLFTVFLLLWVCCTSVR